MRFFSLIIGFLFGAQIAMACERPVCLVDPESLNLPRIITFEDVRSGMGPGHLVSDLLEMDGAVFGERFAGQSVTPAGNHDEITGEALSPLTVMPGDRWQNLSIVFFEGNNILNGYGVAGFPKRHAQGEGAISFLFDADQSALSFQIRGGEDGTAHAIFLSRDGRVIDSLELRQTGEHPYGFVRRSGAADIAGVLFTNTDPQGLALDNLRFGKNPDLS